MAYVIEAVGVIPRGVWLALACMLVEAGILVFGLHAHARAAHWRVLAEAAQAEARGWRALAEREGVGPFGKRTIVARQYHAPRASSSSG